MGSGIRQARKLQSIEFTVETDRVSAGGNVASRPPLGDGNVSTSVPEKANIRSLAWQR